MQEMLRDMCSILGSGRGYGNPIQYSCLENSMDRGAAGYSLWGHKELDTTEWLTHTDHETERETPCICAKSLQSCPTLCNPVYCNPLGSSVCGILQARILEWFAILFSRASSQPRDRTWVSLQADLEFLTILAIREAPMICPKQRFKIVSYWEGNCY